MKLGKRRGTVLVTRYGEYPIYSGCVFSGHINAARFVCRQLGVKDAVIIKRFLNIAYLAT
jgi:hypothetical protein